MDPRTCPTCHGRGVLPEEKVCANETCGATFRWQEGRAEQDQHRSKGVLYCSRRCARAQAERARRRRKAAAERSRNEGS